MYFEFLGAYMLLLSFPFLFWILKKGESHTKKIADIYQSRPPQKSYFVSRMIFVFVFLGSLVVVAAKPHIEYKKTADYIFLIDVSRSMQARYSCGGLTFLDRSKNVMRKILKGIPEARFSIMAFDRFAFPISQMTYNHSYLNEVIENGIYVGLYYQATGTEIENAISVLAQKKARLPEIYGQVNHVILLSDGFVGGDYRRRMSGPLSELRDADIKVTAVGIGNPGETPLMQTEQGRCVEEHLVVNSETIMIPLRDDVLKYIAGETQGQYFSEGETDSVIDRLRNEMQVISSVDHGVTGAGNSRDISWIFLVIATISLFGVLLSGADLRRFSFMR
jgi:hypothetical protein